ncbi:MAG: hypothetical protein PHW74_00740 [Desulfobacca sp.]|nr:hypothetical protein [Desulfobacca sp.]
MCGCGCKMAEVGKTEETLRYYCSQCNAFKEVKKGEPRPECCGKKMLEMD